MSKTSSKQCSETRITELESNTNFKKLSKAWHLELIHDQKQRTRVQVELWFKDVSKYIPSLLFGPQIFCAKICQESRRGVCVCCWLFERIFFLPYQENSLCSSLCFSCISRSLRGVFIRTLGFLFSPLLLSLPVCHLCLIQSRWRCSA